MPPRTLPSPRLVPFQKTSTSSVTTLNSNGIHLGTNTHWNYNDLPNGHVAIIGASGSGKTQTLKAIAWELFKKQECQIIIVDFHGDQYLPHEKHIPLHANSEYGINPLMLNLDPEGGGPKIQAITVGQILKRNLQIGPNQEGLILDVLGELYARFGIKSVETWRNEPPNFSHVQNELEQRCRDGCKESQKLKLKLAATFTYGIFNRTNMPFNHPLIRVDMQKLPPEIGAIAAESLAKQLMDNHRLYGEAATPRTFIFIDEAKELSKSPALDRIVCDGRKYGLNLVVASQSERHLSPDVLSNTATKIVLPVDQVEVEKVAKKFRFAATRVSALKPLQALVRFGNDAKQTDIIPYYQRAEQHSHDVIPIEPTLLPLAE
ncbi:ATP-binding protein [Synechococcus sp. PCC 6312]|uniref:ATP-binding protein n=1 Tax=Synechococcus sp. (strain ATCC 27167 / PCC 6312) TaxID=195253 RepID=UPI00029EEE3F|nr:ATP-binding protein [Synechococcus sp. PCC 6312]AFY61974.1 putative ATPase [Synechococcus sp. PCC 6312]